MPLVRPGGEPLDAPLSDAHERARKINPVFTEGDLVRVAGGRNQSEAELIQGLLLEWGVPATQVHLEFFGPKQELERPKAAAIAAAA